MKSLSLFSRLFITFLVCTVGFLSIAAYAVNKASATDPQLISKLEDKLHIGINIADMSMDGSSESSSGEETTDYWALHLPTTKISLKSYSGDIEIKTTPGKEVLITATGVLNKNKAPRLLQTEVSANEVTIKQPDNGVRHLKVLIQIPEAFANDVDIKTVSGDVTLENLKLNALDLKTISGEITLKVVHAKALDAKTVSGDIKTQDSSISKIEGKSVSGELELSNATPANIDWTSVSGNIKLKLAETKDTHFTLKTTSGNIENKYGSTKNAPFEISISSVSGDIDIE